MMDEKGYMTSTVALSILLICMALLGAYYSVIGRNNEHIRSTESAIVQMIDSRTAHERLYGILSQDIYRDDDIHFEDLDVSYSIEEIERTPHVRIIELTPSDTNEPLTIEISANADGTINLTLTEVGG